MSTPSDTTLQTPPIEPRILNRSPPRPREEDLESETSPDRPNKMSRTGSVGPIALNMEGGPAVNGLGLDALGMEEDHDVDAYIAQMIQDDLDAQNQGQDDALPPLAPIPPISAIPAAAVLEPKGEVEPPKDIEMMEDEDVVKDDGDEDEVDPRIQALEDELSCGMCSALFIDPVVLDGCGHAFCGSCVTLWLKSMPPYPPILHPGDPIPKPISCPHCRHSPIKSAAPSRVVKTLVEVFTLQRPEAKRSDNERKEAISVYPGTSHVGGVIKFPQPPPPPRVVHKDYWRPCKSCYPISEGAWKCPIPVPRAEVPAELPLCLPVDGMCPDGHRLCAGCNRLSPSDSPSSATCSICGEGFCGNPSAHGCTCNPISECLPARSWTPLSNALEDCQSENLPMSFRDNWTEINHLSTYFRHNPSITPATLFKTIITWIRSEECTDSGGILGLMQRSGINFVLRHGMAGEMQAAFGGRLESEVEGESGEGGLVEVQGEGVLLGGDGVGGDVEDVGGGGSNEGLSSESVGEDEAERGNETEDIEAGDQSSTAPQELPSTPVMTTETSQQGKMCGGCVEEIFCAGLFEWWMREVIKPEVKSGLPASMRDRENCKYGRKCQRQGGGTHSVKYNHICEPLPADQADLITQTDHEVGNGGPEYSEGGSRGDDGLGSSDEESEDEDHDHDHEHEERRVGGYVDVGVQWEEGVSGREILVTRSVGEGSLSAGLNGTIQGHDTGAMDVEGERSGISEVVTEDIHSGGIILGVIPSFIRLETDPQPTTEPNPVLQTPIPTSTRIESNENLPPAPAFQPSNPIQIQIPTNQSNNNNSLLDFPPPSPPNQDHEEQDGRDRIPSLSTSTSSTSSGYTIGTIRSDGDGDAIMEEGESSFIPIAGGVEAEKELRNGSEFGFGLGPIMGEE